jgi:arylsulfatase
VPVARQLPYIPIWGSDKTFPHYAVGWSWALDTPFRWVKQIASHFGGMRNGMIIHWPDRIKDRGGIRDQFHHVIDVIPTILEAAGIPAPTVINGITQRPFDGVSMVYTFGDARAPTRRETQYFEMIGNRGIYYEGWFANTTPVAPPWNGMAPRPTDVLNGFPWELYNLADDPTQFKSIADQNQDKLRMMQALFLAEAAKHQVLPLDASGLDRFVAARPGPAHGRQQFVYTGTLHSLQDASAPDLQNRAYRITAEIDVPSSGVNGMIVTHGGRFGGYGLYVVEGKPTFTYNFLNLARAKWQAAALAPGRHTIVFEFEPTSGGLVQVPFGRGGTGILSVDGQQAATRSMARTIPIILTVFETFDVGIDTGTSVDDSDYQVPFPFTGKLEKLTIDLGPTTITPEALAQLNKLLAARNLPVIGSLVGDFEDFLQRMKQGNGP